MDHEAYERQMFDIVNRKAEDKHTDTRESTVTTKKSLLTKTDIRVLRRGLKRTGIALLTTILFALSIFSFIKAATATGYLAVVLFFLAIVLMVFAFVFLYAQGVTDGGSRGDHK